eukprot:CAMPEP_0168787822 /NCGR_PEP_ID=MMETSP0725-20121227/12005_1 /TAXON_ID=265536 /ORGANISM="Amphiprora sp., Strain CCMP467" /LENGTH=354 /DNA_ID=CAMNT_0008838053 /DNA_START=42 /DNA_END=1106 /DNA_ORIENTATION=+
MAHHHRLWRIASRLSAAPIAAAAFSSERQQQQQRPQCDASAPLPKLDPAVDNSLPSLSSNKLDNNNEKSKEPAVAVKTAGMQKDAVGSYKNLFPLRQKWQPKVEYPLWDHNWDGKMPESTGSDEEDRKRMRYIRKNGVTRHIILVRHGQYDETHKEDEKRKLTALGRLQADLTGRRLAEMLKGSKTGKANPCNITSIRVSGMTRAIETADIIATHLPGVTFEEPDPLLNEGRPCHHIPGSKASERIVQVTDDNHARIESAFEKYFQRAEAPDDDEDGEKHEFEIIVCHANVIRYFMCRALQLPPEAWLRYCPFNCSLTYLTIRPTGSVSCRMVGDCGHLNYESSSFSQHHGFVW